jgi:thiamine pyrophosphokinase
MSPQPNRIILFANGDLLDPQAVFAGLSSDDFMIAVDGGLQHMVNLGLTPDLIIGDFDSAAPRDVQHFESRGVEVRRFPAEKDETDLELALQAAIDLHPNAIRVVAALGGRLDQTLGNIFLLTRPEYAGLDLRLIDGIQEVFLIPSQITLTGRPGQRVSLLPLLGPVTGVKTEHLAYPLNSETLYPDHTRGISNLMLDTTATVSIDSGCMLCIHETQKPIERIGKE